MANGQQLRANSHFLPWVLVAVARERLFLRPQILRTLSPGIRLARLAGQDFLLAETGMGSERVRTTLDRLRHESTCSRAIFAGFAGGLRPDLDVGDLLWADEVVAADGCRYRSPDSASCPGRRGVLRSSDRLVSTPADKRRLADEGADAVDMESAAFAAWCAEHAVPWSCVRAVSDAANTTIPSDVFDLVSDRGLSLPRLIRGLVRRPALVGDLWSLGRATRRAARPLAAAIEAWFTATSDVSR
ncbi:MAG TPA: hypothetical protein VHR72_12145 [Gemmataceae bacterium]|nr:hypothetical protein [Gemmataceae bacterium]